MARSHRIDAGFTVVELLVASALALFGVGVMVAFNRAQFLALEDQARQIDLQTTTRAIVDVFAREVRRAGMDPACSKAFAAVASADATKVRFHQDLNGNGVLEAATEDLTYRLVSNRRVERVAGTIVAALLDDVDLTGSRLRYFDGGGAELVPNPTLSAAQRAAVRRVRLELAARGLGGPHPAHLAAQAATDVELRNRFFVAANTCP